MKPASNGLFRHALNPGVRWYEVWAWAMYDFANSGYTTVVITTVFNSYFVGVMAAGKSWGTLALTGTLSISYLMVMLTMPSIGARADAHARKKRVLLFSTCVCVLATLVLALVRSDQVLMALAILAVSNYAYCVGESVIAAFLPEIARPEALGRVSGWGWGWGYFGGMLTLGLSLLWVSQAVAKGLAAPDYVPQVLVITAAIFAFASVPVFLLLRERSAPTQAPVQNWMERLRKAWTETETYFPEFRLLLFCGAFYHAGIAVVVTLAAVYATEAMGFTLTQTMFMVFTVNIAAAVGALVFGHVQDRIGHRRALTATLMGWIIMVLLAYFAIEPWLFWVAATLAGLCMGTSQSAGRAIVGVFAPRQRLAEFYALWTFAIQLAAVSGPLVYGLVTWLTAGNHRLALLVTGLFFVAGLVILQRIDFSAGSSRQV